MDYQQAKTTRKKSFGDLMSEKITGGEGIGSSFKKTLSEKTKAKAMGMKESFDPMNIAKKLTGGSNLAASVVGKMTGRSKEDMEYFTGKKPGKATSSGFDKETMSTAVEILGLIYREMQRANEDKLSQQKSKDNTKETKSDKDKKENDLLIEALTGKKKTRNQKKADRRREKKAEKKSKSAEHISSGTKGTSGKAGLGNAPSVGGTISKGISSAGSAISAATGGAAAAGGAVGTGAAAIGGAAVIGGVVAAGGLMGYASKVIAAHEGLPRGGKAMYDPPNQKQLVSVGFGHQIQADEYKQGFIQAGNEQILIKGERGIDTVVSQSQAQNLLSADLPKYEERAKKPLGDSWNKLNDNQKTALISYAYNTGSTKSLVDAGLKGAIDSGDTQSAAKIIREKGIRTAGGVENKGLVKRRNAEADLFAEQEIKSTEGSTTPSGPVNVNIAKGAEEQKSTSDSASKVGSGTLMQNIKLKDGSVDVDGLNNQVKSNFAKMAHEYFIITGGKKIQVNSAFRSMAEQEELYRTKPPGIAAKPGSSMHNYGFAIDISSADANALVQMGLMQKWGFERPVMPKETWHIAPKGLSHELAKKGIFSADAPTDQGGKSTAAAEPSTVTSGAAIQNASNTNKELKEQAEKEKKPTIVNNTNIGTQKQDSNPTVAANGDDTPAYLKKARS